MQESNGTILLLIVCNFLGLASEKDVRKWKKENWLLRNQQNIVEKIIEFNESLDNNPEDINNDPYGKGWVVKVEIDDTNEVNNLLSAQQYKELIGVD